LVPLLILLSVETQCHSPSTAVGRNPVRDVRPPPPPKHSQVRPSSQGPCLGPWALGPGSSWALGAHRPLPSLLATRYSLGARPHLPTLGPGRPGAHRPVLVPPGMYQLKGLSPKKSDPPRPPPRCPPGPGFLSAGCCGARRSRRRKGWPAPCTSTRNCPFRLPVAVAAPCHPPAGLAARPR
jgi:hypothetical protein